MEITKEYTYEELQHLINSLDQYSRIFTGQYDIVLDKYIWYLAKEKRVTIDKIREVEKLLYSIRYLFIPTLDDDSRRSLGILSYDTPETAKKAYDIHQVLRFQKAWYLYPEGGYTVIFFDPYICGTWNVDKIDLLKIRYYIDRFDYRKRRFNIMWNCPIIVSEFLDDKCTVLMNKEVEQIIETALQIDKLLDEFQIGKVFSKLYPSVSYEEYKEVTNKCEELLNGL